MYELSFNILCAVGIIYLIVRVVRFLRAILLLTFKSNDPEDISAIKTTLGIRCRNLTDIDTKEINIFSPQ